MFSCTWSARRHCQSFHAIKNTNSNSNKALLDSRVSGSHVWYLCVFPTKTAIWKLKHQKFSDFIKSEEDAEERRGRAKMVGQQDEVERSPKAALVLSDV